MKATLFGVYKVENYI